MGRPYYFFPLFTGSYTLIVDNKYNAKNSTSHATIRLKPSTGKHFSVHGVKHPAVKGFSVHHYLWHDFICLHETAKMLVPRGLQHFFVIKKQ